MDLKETGVLKKKKEMPSYDWLWSSSDKKGKRVRFCNGKIDDRQILVVVKGCLGFGHSAAVRCRD